MLNYIKNKFSIKTKKTGGQLTNKEMTANLFNYIIEHSYYDEKTNTLVVNTPTNIVFKSKGSIMTIAEEGYIVNIADSIHLNPDLSEQTKINIRKLDKGFDEVMYPLSESIK